MYPPAKIAIVAMMIMRLRLRDNLAPFDAVRPGCDGGGGWCARRIR